MPKTTKTKEKVENTPSQPKWESEVVEMTEHYSNNELTRLFIGGKEWLSPESVSLLLATKIEIDEVVGMIDNLKIEAPRRSEHDDLPEKAEFMQEIYDRVIKPSLKQKLLDRAKIQ